ncbi:unnamed protein product [Ectocarpus sp. 13 AM-2016]
MDAGVNGEAGWRGYHGQTLLSVAAYGMELEDDTNLQQCGLCSPLGRRIIFNVKTPVRG